MEKLQLTEIEKLKALPVSINDAYNDLETSYQSGVKGSILTAIMTSRVIFTAMKEFGIEKIDPLLKSKKWVAMFKLPIEDRQVKNYHKVSPLLILGLEKGVQISPSSLIPFVSLLEKKEYKKVIPLFIKDIFSQIDNKVDKLTLEEFLISKFTMLPTPKIEDSITDVIEYKTALEKVQKTSNDIAIEKAKVKEVKQTETFIKLTESQFKNILKSVGVNDTNIETLIKEYSK